MKWFGKFPNHFTSCIHPRVVGAGEQQAGEDVLHERKKRPGQDQRPAGQPGVRKAQSAIELEFNKTKIE